MDQRHSRQSGKAWWLPLAAIVAVFCLACGGIWFAASAGSKRILDGLRWLGEPKWSSIHTGLDGSVRLENFQLTSDSGLLVSARTARIKTQGLFWLAGAAFDKDAVVESPISSLFARDRVARLKSSAAGLPARFPKTDYLQIDLFDVSAGTELQSFGDLNWIGLRTGALLDGAACARALIFTADELKKIKMPKVPVNAQIALNLQNPGIAKVSLNLAANGFSQASFAMTLGVDDPRLLLDSDWRQWILHEKKWVINDLGFNVLRNRVCTGFKGLGRDGYVEQHVQAIQHHLLALGFAPSDDLINSYRRYLVRGGRLTWVAKPSPAVAWRQLSRFKPAEQLKVLNATMETLQGRPSPFAFKTVARIDMPFADNFNPEPETLASMLENAPSQAVPLQVSVPPQVAPSAAAPAQVATTVAPPTTANATPPPAPEKPPQAAMRRVEYEQLTSHIGKKVFVETIYGSVRVGRLEDYTRAAITISLLGPDAGRALTIPSDTVRKVEVEH